MNKEEMSRRSFIRKSAVTAGIAAVTPMGFAAASGEAMQAAKKSNREVWIAGISQMVHSSSW